MERFGIVRCDGHGSLDSWLLATRERNYLSRKRGLRVRTKARYFLGHGFIIHPTYLGIYVPVILIITTRPSIQSYRQTF